MTKQIVNSIISPNVVAYYVICIWCLCETIELHNQGGSWRQNNVDTTPCFKCDVAGKQRLGFKSKQRGYFGPMGPNLNKLGRGTLVDAKI